MTKTILIVDDSISIRQVVGMTLKGAGFNVIEACDGRDALKLNLIISDVNMPNTDDISLVGELKKQPSYRFTPVIMLTTEGAENKKAAGKAAGVKAWVDPLQGRANARCCEQAYFTLGLRYGIAN